MTVAYTPWLYLLQRLLHGHYWWQALLFKTKGLVWVPYFHEPTGCVQPRNTLQMRRIGAVQSQEQDQLLQRDFQLDNEDLGWFGWLLELAPLRAADAWYRWISEHMSDICRVEFSISTNIYTQIHQTFVQEVPRDFHRLSPGGGRSEAGRTWILFGCFTWGYICVGFFRALQCGEWNSDCYKLYNHTPLSTVWNAQQTMAIPNLNLMLWCFRATILSFMLLHYVLFMCMVCPINK